MLRIQQQGYKIVDCSLLEISFFELRLCAFDIFFIFFDFFAGNLFLAVYYEIRQHSKCIEKVKFIDRGGEQPDRKVCTIRYENYS